MKQELNWNQDFSTIILHPEQDPIKQLIAKEDDEERYWNSYNNSDNTNSTQTQKV